VIEHLQALSMLRNEYRRNNIEDLVSIWNTHLVNKPEKEYVERTLLEMSSLYSTFSKEIKNKLTQHSWMFIGLDENFPIKDKEARLGIHVIETFKQEMKENFNVSDLSMMFSDYTFTLVSWKTSKGRFPSIKLKKKIQHLFSNVIARFVNKTYKYKNKYYRVYKVISAYTLHIEDRLFDDLMSVEVRKTDKGFDVLTHKAYSSTRKQDIRYLSDIKQLF
jgi:hypothetical protein